MKIELIKTKESDGDWYKVYVNGICNSCVKIDPTVTNRTEDKALERATAIYDFIKENQGEKQVIKSEEI